MPDFLYLYRGTEPVTSGLSPQQMQDYLSRFRTWAMGLTADGKMRAGAPLAPPAKTLRGGTASPVVDGPYAEAKDVIGGYSVVTTPTFDDAVALARGCPFLELGGTVEIRPILGID